MLTYEKYNHEKLAVRGDKEKYSSFMKTIGGRWNSRMKGGEGWFVPSIREESLKSYINEDVIDNNKKVFESSEDEDYEDINPIVLQLLKKNNLINNDFSEKSNNSDEEEEEQDDEEEEQDDEEQFNYNSEKQELERQELEELEKQELERQELEKQELERQELERQELERQELERQELERQELERQKIKKQELERQELKRQELEELKKQELERQELDHESEKKHSRYCYDSDDSHNSEESKKSHTTSGDKKIYNMKAFKQEIMEKQREKEIRRRENPKYDYSNNKKSKSSSKYKQKDAVEYYTGFSKNPGKFKTMYVDSESSEEGMCASSSDYSESSDDFPSPDSPRKFTGNKELLIQLKDLQRKVHELEIKNQKLRSELRKK